MQSKGTGIGNKLEAAGKPACDMAVAVWENLQELRVLHIKLRGTPLMLPADLKPAEQRWLDFLERASRGDRRISAAEAQATKHMAQWTLDVKNELRNQPQKTLFT